MSARTNVSDQCRSHLSRRRRRRPLTQDRAGAHACIRCGTWVRVRARVRARVRTWVRVRARVRSEVRVTERLRSEVRVMVRVRLG